VKEYLDNKNTLMIYLDSGKKTTTKRGNKMSPAQKEKLQKIITLANRLKGING